MDNNRNARNSERTTSRKKAMKPKWFQPDNYTQRHHSTSYNWLGCPTEIWTITIGTDAKRPALRDAEGDYYSWRNCIESDGNSSPVLCRPWFPQTLGLPTAFLHDDAYQNHELLLMSPEGQWWSVPITREQADELARQGWIAAGVPEEEARIAWRLLRAFGWYRWNQGRDLQALSISGK